MSEPSRSKRSPEPEEDVAKAPALPICGLVMPISECEGLSMRHWEEVRTILTKSLEAAGMEAKLVSADDRNEMIHQSIILNLNTYPLVVCDVSCGNPNVMLELGMRLAFDKPTIIVKDKVTPFRFDSNPIRHLVYPRDLRYSEILTFQSELRDLAIKVLGSVEKKDYKTFLSQFELQPAQTASSGKLEGDPPQPNIRDVLVRLTRMEHRISNWMRRTDAVALPVPPINLVVVRGEPMSPKVRDDLCKYLAAERHFHNIGYRETTTGVDLLCSVPSDMPKSYFSDKLQAAVSLAGADDWLYEISWGDMD